MQIIGRGQDPYSVMKEFRAGMQGAASKSGNIMPTWCSLQDGTVPFGNDIKVP